MDLTEDAPNCFDVSERFHLKTPSLLSTFASQTQDTVVVKDSFCWGRVCELAREEGGLKGENPNV